MVLCFFFDHQRGLPALVLIHMRGSGEDRLTVLPILLRNVAEAFTSANNPSVMSPKGHDRLRLPSLLASFDSLNKLPSSASWR